MKITLVDWSEVQEEVQEALDYFESEGVTPTLRTGWYLKVLSHIQTKELSIITMNKKQKKIVKYIVIFVILFYAWLSFHELTHYSICRLSGNKGHLNLFTDFKVGCPGMDDGPKLTIFIYYSIPYITILVILLILWRAKDKNIFVKVLPYPLIMDSFGNFIGTLFTVTDFTNIYAIGIKYYLISSIFIFLIAVISCFIFIRDFKKLRKWFYN